MRHTKIVDVPATTQVVIESVTCDLCGAVIKDSGNIVDEVEVFHKTGERYPDSCEIRSMMVDMCGKCFDGKLVPWLESQGAVMRAEEIEW